MNAKVGGIAALSLAAGYILIIPVFSGVGAQPAGDGDAWLRYMAGHTTQWWVILALSVATDVLYIPVGLALYAVLRGISQSAMLIAVTLLSLFVVLDLALTWPSYAALIGLAVDYASTSDAARRAALSAAANYPAALLASRLFTVYAIVIPGVGIGMIGGVMLRGAFSRATAFVGLATAILGVAALSGLAFTVVGAALLTTAWMLLVGYRLVRLA